MEFSEKITSVLDKRDLSKFTELANHPALLINEIFKDGLLHYLLVKYPQLPLEFYKVLLDIPATDVNKISSNRLPPILSTERADLQDLLLDCPRTNVNVFIDRVANMKLINAVLKVNDMVLFKKLLEDPKTDLIQRDVAMSEDMTLLNYAMTNNIEGFKLLIRLGHKIDVNRSGLYYPIEYAVKTENIEAFKLLLEKDATFDLIIDYLVDSESKKPKLAEMVELLCTKYFDKISDKGELLHKAILLDKTKIVDIYIANKYFNHIPVELFKTIIEHPNIVKLLISNINHNDLATVQLTEYILNLNNIELIELLLTNVDMDKITYPYITILSETENIELIRVLINSKISYLKGNSIVERILLANNGNILSVLSNYRQLDLINMLLEFYPKTVFPDRYNPIDAILSNEQYDLLVTLMMEFNVCLYKKEQYETLIGKHKLDTLEIAFEIGSKKDPYLIRRLLSRSVIEILGPKFMFDLMNNPNVDYEIFQWDIFHYIINIPGFELYAALNIETIYPFIRIGKARGEPNADDFRFLFRFMEDRDLNNIPAIRLINKGEDGIRIVDTILRQIADEVSLEEAGLNYLNLIEHIIEGKNQEIFDLWVSRFSLYVQEPAEINFNIGYSLVKSPEFILNNIDTLLRNIPGIYLNYISDLQVAIIANPELFRTSQIARKMMNPQNYNPAKMVEKEDIDRNEFLDYTQLTHYILMVKDSTLDKNVKSIVLDIILETIGLHLEQPNNNINESSDYMEKYTILEVLASLIRDFSEEIDYSSTENYSFYHKCIKMILAHRTLNLSRHVNLLSILSNTDVRLKDLLNIVLSHPSIDVNENYMLHNVCASKNIITLNILLSIDTVNINLKDMKGNTPLHVCLHNSFKEGAIVLINDPRIDLSTTDLKGRSYARVATKAGISEINDLLASRGIIDSKKSRIDRLIAEYDARNIEKGRVKQTRIRETLNSLDLILKEERKDIDSGEDEEGNFRGSITPYSRTMCPFCLTYIEKESPYECVYVGSHKCPAELENEPLKRLYFGEGWRDKIFEICCICGRPCEHHGHFKISLEGDPVSELLPNGSFANHWDCNSHNGGGERIEMVTRTVSILSELKRRVDLDQRLVYGPELILELAIVANNSLRNEEIKSRAVGILERKKWNSNSKIEKYLKFNAPTPTANASNRAREEREPIVYYGNSDHTLQCMICLEEMDHLFKPHASDEGYICDICIKGQVCSAPYSSVTCELGCRPKKQIFKEDVNALLHGNLCQS
jgi:ankyrin repeat protein